MASRRTAKIINSIRTLEGGGFEVRRPFGGRSYIDPFLMLDHFGPQTYAPGKAVGAPDHPHRGQTTISYILEGELEHKDSAGHSGFLRNGDVQWMDAANGVVHSEMPSRRLQEEGGRMEGFQIWVNLPVEFKRAKPRYQEVPAATIPHAKLGSSGSEVIVVAGESAGTKGPVETRTPITYLDVRLQPGDELKQPVTSTSTALIYVYRGVGLFGSDRKVAEEGQLVVLEAGEVVEMKAGEKELRCLFLGGEPLKIPVVSYGPFVMTSMKEIEEAFEDYQAGRLGEIPGKEERYAQTAAATGRSR